MFGRKMYGLENFVTEIAEQDQLQIYKRAIELKKQLEFDVPQEKTAINHSQEQQKTSQNAAHNITETP
jgi:hypothetical protein